MPYLNASASPKERYLKVQNFGQPGWPDIHFLDSVSLTKIPTCYKFELVGFVPVLRCQENMVRILDSELLSKNWIMICFIFSWNDVN